METFRGSILRPRVPLSTLRRRPHGRPRMTRGHRDWLGLRRTELASATTCRSPGARRWRNRAAGWERRDGQAAALQAGLYGVGDPPQASIGSLWRTAMKHYVGLDVAME